MYYTITNRIQWKIVWQAAICPKMQGTVSGARALHLFPVNSGNSARSLEIVQSIFDNTA